MIYMIYCAAKHFVCFFDKCFNGFKTAYGSYLFAKLRNAFYIRIVRGMQLTDLGKNYGCRLQVTVMARE